MGKPYIAERLLKRRDTRNPIARQKAIRVYEKERAEAAEEIYRLDSQLSAVHACAADNEYAQWERISLLEEALIAMLRVFGKPIHDGSIDGGASYNAACKIVNCARAVLEPPAEPLATVFCFH